MVISEALPPTTEESGQRSFDVAAKLLEQSAICFDFFWKTKKKKSRWCPGIPEGVRALNAPQRADDALHEPQEWTVAAHYTTMATMELCGQDWQHRAVAVNTHPDVDFSSDPYLIFQYRPTPNQWHQYPPIVTYALVKLTLSGEFEL